MWLSNNVDLRYISIRDLTWEWILEMDRTRTLEHDIYYIITVWCEIKIKMKDQVFLFAQLQHSSKSWIGSWLCLLSHFVTVLCQHGIVWSRHTGPLIQQLLLSPRFFEPGLPRKWCSWREGCLWSSVCGASKSTGAKKIAEEKCKHSEDII